MRFTNHACRASLMTTPFKALLQAVYSREGRLSSWPRFFGSLFSGKKTHKYALQLARNFPYCRGVNISQPFQSGKTKYVRRKNS
jgi:hypothetical protein